MKRFGFAFLGISMLCAGFAGGAGLPQQAAADDPNALIGRYCFRCHNDVLLTGGLTLESFDATRAGENPELAEKIIRKLRTGMMPPPTAQRPTAQTYAALLAALETTIDAAAAADPNPGSRTFQRLNRAEYGRVIHDILALDIDAGAYLPLDTKSANFDNIADVQLMSPTLMGAYLRAASEVSRLAVGDPEASISEATYKVSRWESQRDRVEGAPQGTRGGVSVVHNFPADGDYVVKVSFHHETTGALFGNGRGALHTAEREEQLEVSINGQRVALLELGRWMHASDPNGVTLRTEPFAVRAGPQRITAAFITRFEGPAQDLISPHEWSLSSTSVAGAYGITSLPHLRDMVISGPYDPTGVSETPSRRRIFHCRPTTAAEEIPCAERILREIGSSAYRRQLSDDELGGLMAFYGAGAAGRGFESGIRAALEAMLASPHFVFRIEEMPAGVGAHGVYRIRDIDLASRLSFFLWASVPDRELIDLAVADELSQPEVLEAQVRRMLADPRSEALATRFAGQWLRLQDLDKIHPDVREYPDFDEQLRAAMRRETEMFFENLVREDRSVLELVDADYTFVNERLAKHYRIADIAGTEFRRVTLEGERRGLLGHASILTLTSHAGRTSPVLRGKWVMEVFLGSPPPPPPPNVPDLEETDSVSGGRFLTVRERMEEHRSNPACMSCHRVIDPLGLVLENFDATGAWRIKDNGAPIESTGVLYDGTVMEGPAGLRAALLNRPEVFLSTFTENLMAYALGRRVEYYDMPTIRSITREAAGNGYRISTLVLGVVNSSAFQMSAREAAEAAPGAKDVQEEEAIEAARVVTEAASSGRQ